MSHTSNPKSIEEFLFVIQGGKEVGLVIAKDEAETLSFAKVMDRFDFEQLYSIFEYQNANHGWYVVINDQTRYKEAYDFICQYPLTVISLFDSVNSKTFSVKPNYKTPIIFVITEETLKDIQKTGLDLLGRVGPAYRTE